MPAIVNEPGRCGSGSINSPQVVRVLRVEPTGGVGADDAVSIALRGVDAADESALECAGGGVGARAEVSVDGYRSSALGHKAEVSQSLLLFGDEERIVRGVAHAFGALADGAGAAAGVARHDGNAESFGDSIDQHAAAESALEAAGGGVGVAFGRRVAGRVGEDPEPAGVGKRLGGEQVARQNGVVGEAGCVERRERGTGGDAGNGAEVDFDGVAGAAEEVEVGGGGGNDEPQIGRQTSGGRELESFCGGDGGQGISADVADVRRY